MLQAGPWIRKARETHGLSRFELATRAGYDHTYLYRVELNQRAPSREVLEDLCDALTMDTEARALVLAAAGFLPIWDEEFERLVAAVAAHWAARPLHTDLIGDEPQPDSAALP